MMKKLVTILCIGWGFPLAAQQKVPAAIMEILDRQQQCWNSGDLQCFMKGYWESDSLMFIGKDIVYYGYQNTLDRYKTAYPDRESMGILTFEFLSWEPLGDDAYYMVGAYHLQRSVGDLHGHFTLLWKKIKGEWVIVADHSS